MELVIQIKHVMYISNFVAHCSGEDALIINADASRLASSEYLSMLQDTPSIRTSTAQVEIVVDSSLAPVTSLLMPFTSPTDPVVYHGGLTESAISHQ